MKSQQNKLSFSVEPEVSKGTYSNLAIITHSYTEFIVDFAQMLPGGDPNDAPVRQRILMHPLHAKHLLNALQDNVKKYESVFGEICEPNYGIDSDTIEMIPKGNA